MWLFVFFISPLSMLQNQKSTWPSILFKDGFVFANLLGLERNASRRAQPAPPPGGSEQLRSGAQTLPEKALGPGVHLWGEELQRVPHTRVCSQCILPSGSLGSEGCLPGTHSLASASHTLSPRTHAFSQGTRKSHRPGRHSDPVTAHIGQIII